MRKFVAINFIEMENVLQLVLKNPEGKLPFIGILFPSDYLGARENQRMVNEFKNSLYKVEFRPIKNEATKIDVIVTQYVHNLKGEYKNVQMNAEKLKKFLDFNYNAKYFNFGHISVKHNNHYPLKTSHKGDIWVLRVEEVKINMI